MHPLRYRHRVEERDAAAFQGAQQMLVGDARMLRDTAAADEFARETWREATSALAAATRGFAERAGAWARSHAPVLTS